MSTDAIATGRRSQGRLWLKGDTWSLTCAPHVVTALKRVFPRLPFDAAVFSFKHTPEACADLAWFALRYPLDVLPLAELQRMAKIYEQQQREWEAITAPDYVPGQHRLALPLRHYQAQAVDLFLARHCLMLGDDVGLGKTAVAIGSFANAKALPGVVVTYGHLQTQWKSELEKFLPGINAHIIQTREPYNVQRAYVIGRKLRLDGPRSPDVVILTYTKLAHWWYHLAHSFKAKAIVYDEVQELRREDSDKYKAAAAIAQKVPLRMGLSATPIYNHGGEMFNVMDALAPGCLGMRDEFRQQWCVGGDGGAGKWPLKDPAALGSYLRSEHLMLRRTRQEVGRELPAVSKFTQEVEPDESMGTKEKNAAIDLAKLILSNDKKGRGVSMQEAGEFNAILRRATGLVKATAVADFVRLMVEQGEPVILGGWHHAVYDVWREKLKDLNPVFYTGQESNVAKNRARDQFVKGDSPLMILSVRAGVGLDGLQERCRNVVFGELDWSPGPHKQFIGRVHRDGQALPVFAYFLFTDWGCDPDIVDVLGLKSEQAKGINDPWAGNAPELDDRAAAVRAKALAFSYLRKNGQL